VQETLRYHPVVHNTFREAIKDDLLPLSKPIITSSGEIINEIPVPKGLKIITSIGGYNRFRWSCRCGEILIMGAIRNQDIFGEDAHIFDPERWLHHGIKKATNVGVLANLYVSTP
jgi:cytochrome P450